MATTAHLNIEKIGGTEYFADEAFNKALDSVDEQVNDALTTHANNASHWKLWEPTTVYEIGDIVRYASLKSSQYIQCTAHGTSGTVVPTVNVTGTTITDNGVTWIVRELVEPVTVHNDLTGRGATGAHPISAITDLQTTLDAKVNKTDYTEAGIIDFPTITDNGNGSISLTGGNYNIYADGTGSTPLTKYAGVNQTITLTDGVNNFVCAHVNTNVIEYILTDRTNIDYRSVLPVYTVFRNGTTLEPVLWGTYAKGLASLLLKWKNRTSRFTRESGLMISESTGRLINITSGIVWFSVNELALEAVNSSTDDVYQCVNTNGTWTYTKVTQYNNTQYNDITSGLVTLSNNKYNVTWVYRDVKTDVKKLYLVLGTGNYTLSEAQASTIPTIPAMLETQCILVGRIICEKEETVATSVTSAFLVGFSGGSGSTNASDITINDAGNYFTGSDVENALQELGADKHTHSNKTQLDKIGEDLSGNLTYNGNSVVGGAKTWTTSTAYIVGQLVTYGGCLYKCVTAHTSSAFNTDISNWSIVYANIQPWTTSIYYPLNSWVFNGTTLYKCTTAHISRASMDTTELTYWAIGGSAVGISSMTYDGTASTFSVTLSDNTTKTFNGIGSNFYEGYAKTDIITTPITAIGNYNLSHDITAQDFLHFTVGVAEGYYKPFNIKTSDIMWTKTLNSVVQTTSLGSGGTVTISGTPTKTVDAIVYLKVVTAPTATGSLAGMVVGISDDGITYASQTAFTAGLTATLTYNGVIITFTVTASTTFIVNELYTYSYTIVSPTKFLMDGTNGSSNYAIVCYFKNNNILVVDSLSSTIWTNPQIINMNGYKGQSNNVTALKTNLLYSNDNLGALPAVGGRQTCNLSDSLKNYDFVYITVGISTVSTVYAGFNRLIKTSDLLDTMKQLNGPYFWNSSNYLNAILSVDSTENILYFNCLDRAGVVYGGIFQVYGIVSGDGKVTMSQSQQNGKYSLTLTNVDGTSTIELPYVTLLSGNVAEISGDNTLHITHADNSVTIGQAAIKCDTLFNSTVGSSTGTAAGSITLSYAISNYKYISFEYSEVVDGSPSYRLLGTLKVSSSQLMSATGAVNEILCCSGYASTSYYVIIRYRTDISLYYDAKYSFITKIVGIY